MRLLASQGRQRAARWSDKRVRIAGALIAVSISAMLFVGQLAIGVSIDVANPNPLTLITPMAIPVSALLSWRHAPRVTRTPEFDMLPVALFAFQGVIAGAMAISSIGLVRTWIVFGGLEPVAVIGGFVASVASGLLLFGLPIFVLGWVCVIGWALILRGLVGWLSQPSG